MSTSTRNARNNSVSEDNFSKLFEKIDKLSTELKTEFTTGINNAVIKLEQSIADGQRHTNARIHVLELHREELERQNRIRDVIIRGVPSLPGENLWKLFEKIMSALNFEFQIFYSIDTIFRLGNSANKPGSSNAILVKFATLKLKQEFMASYFSDNNLRLSNIGINSDSRIFISENLSKANNILLKRAIELRKSGTVEKVSTKFGYVLVKWKNENKFVKITSVTQFEN